MLHIVSFNVPWPADYGGVVDVFYRLKTLHAMGVPVHLHCFAYGRPEAPQLEQYCARVSYYKRDTSPLRALQREPYIVASRCNKQLFIDISHDQGPVLLEGLHCCALLESLSDRPVYVRAHNVEHDYYSRLAFSEQRWWKRFYLRSEARKLKRYEHILARAAGIFAVTEADAAHFRSIGCKDVWLMPSSHTCETIQSLPGQGTYALFHADLSVADNNSSAIYLIENVFSKTDTPAVIAGRQPSPQLVALAGRYPHIRIVPNPDDDKMSTLIRDAQVNILVTNQPTGLKLKLLNALYQGRHCLVNSHMVAGTELGQVCHIADDPALQRSLLAQLMSTPFTDEDIEKRKALLGNLYSNEANAKILVNHIINE
ncbi:MAG: glycosyltransferase [Bacteroidales bacterium]|nr:glycosyltransferase [Bacteroidales bacterium]